MSLRPLALSIGLLLLPVTVWGQHSCCVVPKHTVSPDAPIPLLSGLGTLHHAVSTQNGEAQKYFDQGLSQVYAFNHDEAARSFHKAAQLDQKLAMAWWGVALATGPNYNDPATHDSEKQPFEAIQKARALAGLASPEERAYIEALAKRFSVIPGADLGKLNQSYADAMRQVFNANPNDPDAATLYADSLMTIHAWKLWGNDGRPAPGTLEAIRALQAALTVAPNHLGANHFYIHALEASPHPEQALGSADKLPGLAPAAGHLVHMPAHIYLRVGDYEAAATSNEAALAADASYFAKRGTHGDYYGHNIAFLMAARRMEGHYQQALVASERFDPHGTEPLLTQARFAKWNEIERVPEPKSGSALARAYWHYARGLADAALGKVAEAEAHERALASAQKATSVSEYSGWASNRSLLSIAELVLAAKIALAKHSEAQAVKLLQQAVALQDALPYDEPVDWYYPVRESLGGALLSTRRYADAEQVFREDLRRNPKNGRSLFGLAQSLIGQKKESQVAQADFEAAWKRADTSLKATDL